MSSLRTLASMVAFLATYLFADSALAQPGVVGCINTTGGDPDLGTNGTIFPVNIDLGPQTFLTYGRDPVTSSQEGGSLIDSTMEVNDSIPDGCSITTGMLVLGERFDTVGEFTVRGPTVSLTLTGPFNRLDIGSQGLGRMRVLNGAYVNAAINPQNCPSEFCNNFVGNIAGSVGFLTVSGPGSRLDAINFFGIGQAAVHSPEQAGGDGRGEVLVLDGGALNTRNGVVSGGPVGAMPSGFEETLGIVTVDGPGSVWTTSENIQIAPNINSTGIVTVSNDGAIAAFGGIQVFEGGTLIVDNAIVKGNIFNSGGTISPGSSPGDMNIEGSFFQVSGETVIEFQGSLEEDFDVIRSTGSVLLLNGQLTLKFSKGFAPAAGQELPFFQAQNFFIADATEVLVEGLLPGFEYEIDGSGRLIALSNGFPDMVEAMAQVRLNEESSNLNLVSNQLFQVAILTTQSDPIFDATQVDPATVEFGPSRAGPELRKTTIQDVDSDGDADLKLWFRVAQTGLSCGDTDSELVASTYAGTLVEATASLMTICPY